MVTASLTQNGTTVRVANLPTPLNLTIPNVRRANSTNQTNVADHNASGSDGVNRRGLANVEQTSVECRWWNEATGGWSVLTLSPPIPAPPPSPPLPIARPTISSVPFHDVLQVT